MYGPTCREELSVLKEEIARRSGRHVSLNVFKELENPSVFLCIQCQKLLLKKNRLKAQIQEITKNIDSKLGLLTEKTPRTRQVAEQDITQQGASSSASPEVIVSFVSTLY